MVGSLAIGFERPHLLSRKGEGSMELEISTQPSSLRVKIAAWRLNSAVLAGLDALCHCGQPKEQSPRKQPGRGFDEGLLTIHASCLARDVRRS